MRHHVLAFNPDNGIAFNDSTGNIRVHHEGEYAVTCIVFAQNAPLKEESIFLEINGITINESSITLAKGTNEVHTKRITLFLTREDTLSLSSSPLWGEMSLSLMIEEI